MTFQIDGRLAQDTLPVTDLDLCAVRLMNDSRYPWLVLIPQRAGLEEIIDLEARGKAQLWSEIGLASEALREIYAPHKLNIGALGNIVRQLHIHVLGRSENDPAWPGPVWGHSPALAYSEAEAAKTCQSLAQALRSVTA